MTLYQRLAAINFPAVVFWIWACGAGTVLVGLLLFIAGHHWSGAVFVVLGIAVFSVPFWLKPWPR